MRIRSMKNEAEPKDFWRTDRKNKYRDVKNC